MSLALLQISAFRNLTRVELELNPHFNLFYGQNGAGKTGLLEAVYFLIYGRSFRTNVLLNVIQNAADACLIFARSYPDDSGVYISVGVERKRVGSSVTHLNGEALKRRTELARLVPLQLLDVHGYLLLEGGPRYRRKYLDWGVFHVEPLFYPYWQKARRAIEQRNALLKRQSSAEQCVVWDEELSNAGIEIDRFRVSYIASLQPIFAELTTMLLEGVDISLQYFPGWSAANLLFEQLQQRFVSDQRIGFTSVGPHKADLKFSINDVPAQDRLSRGQQKLLIMALQLAQGMLLHKITGRSCLYLIDDLPSELDTTKRELVYQLLQRINAQTFITGIHKSDMILPSATVASSRFHVEQGAIASI